MGTFPVNQRHNKNHNSSKDEQKKKPIHRQMISGISRKMIIVNTNVMVINTSSEIFMRHVSLIAANILDTWSFYDDSAFFPVLK